MELGIDGRRAMVIGASRGLGRAIAASLAAEGAVRLTRMAVPGMRERHYGRIIAIVSSGVIVPLTNLVISNTIRLGAGRLGQNTQPKSPLRGSL